MSVTIRVEGAALHDPRYVVLAQLCGLADGDHARGRIEHLWAYCTDRQVYHVPVDIVCAVLGSNGVNGLIRSGLGDKTACADHEIRIRGTKGRIEWLGKLRKNAKKGGKARAGQRASQKATHLATQKATHLDSQTPAIAQPLPSPPSPSPSPSPTGVPDSAESAPPARATHAPPPAPTPSGAVDGDPRATARRRIMGAIGPLHVATFNRTRDAVGSTARAMQPVGDPAERELRELLLGLDNLDGVEDDCRHVLAVREAEALAAGSVRYLGASVWTPSSFARAKAMTVDEARTNIASLTHKRATGGAGRRSGFDALVAAASEEMP